MPTLVTSLHHKYQPKLDVLWGVRELGSNGIDGEERHRYLGVGSFSVSYSKRSKTLTLRNDGITVSSTALLMGTSDSRENEECIGQFGEGLPMALLVLARSGIPVTIYNGAEKWVPAIERSEEYGNEPVLVVKTRKMLKDRGGFEVQIEDIDGEEYEEFLSLFLRFDKSFDPDETVARFAGANERVLLQPQYHGRIYNKGVFVMKRDDLMFGYDLHGDLNRDRSFMDEWDLKSSLSNLLSRAVRAGTEQFADLLVRALLDKDDALEADYDYSDLAYNSILSDRVTEEFLSRHGENSIAVDSDSEVKEAERMGLNGVQCSPVLRRILQRKLGTLDKIKDEQANSISRTWSYSSLGSVEKQTLDTVKLLITAAFPGAEKIDFEVVSFGSDEVRYIYDSESRKVQLAKSHLLDFETTLESAARGACAVEGDWNREIRVLSRIITQLTKGTGTAGLAMTLLGQEA